jgi:hypothetical protein
MSLLNRIKHDNVLHKYWRHLYPHTVEDATVATYLRNLKELTDERRIKLMDLSCLEADLDLSPERTDKEVCKCLDILDAIDEINNVE